MKNRGIVHILDKVYMKLRSSIFLLLAIGACLVSAYYPKTDPDPKEKEVVIFETLLAILDQAHFDPKTLDDEFSAEAFETFLKYIDYGKRFLTQEDIDALEQYRLEIDDQTQTHDLTFFNAALERLDAGFAKAEKYYGEVIATELPDNDAGMIQLDSEKKEWVSNDQELKERWKTSITYDYISDIYELREDQKNLAVEEEDELTVEEIKVNTNTANKLVDKLIEKEDQEDLAVDEEKLTEEQIKIRAKEKVQERWDKWFVRMGKLRRSDRFESYLNTFTHIFDPHTDYYNPKEKQDFDINMGGKLEGIGARLSSEGDYIKVVDIIPGGPAWKGKELEVDDKIMAVTQDGEVAVNVVGWRTDDAVQLIRGKKGTIVHLKVKKTDNTVETIRIERDEVIIDASFARSVIMDIPEKIENIGYIKLPKFYSSFERKGGNSCAEDIRIELEKLTEQNVSGIILDLRNNGGGSLNDVVKMSGLFIEDGPIVQVKPREKRPYVYEDTDVKVQWDGPLIVMVNSYSASASEILAAALQDYNRALIVGSNSTFGKGTVQRFFNLDKAISGVRDMKPLGELKLTMQKFYRIDGGSTQLKGVIPDINFPDRFSFIDVGEKDYDFAMPWSEIKPVEYNQNVFQLKGVDDLKAKSEKRVSENSQFQLMTEYAQKIKDDQDDSQYPLDVDAFGEFMTNRKLANDKFDELMSDTLQNLSIKNLEADLEYINLDESRVARNDDWIEGLYKDIYVEETLLIMRDLIETHDTRASVDTKKRIKER